MNYRIDILFILFLTFVLTHGCKSDSEDQRNSAQNEQEVNWEEQYLEDYESPEFKWGFIDKEGTLVIDAKFEEVGKFSEGKAAVNRKGKWAFIDRQGKPICPFQYLSVHPFSEGLAGVQRFDGTWSFIDEFGNELKTMELEQVGSFSEGKAKVQIAYMWGFIDKTGTLIIEPIYESAGDFSSGFSKVKRNGQYQCIDSSGDEVLPSYFERVWEPGDGYILVKNEDGYFFFSDKGDLELGPYDWASSFHDGYAFVRKELELYVVDQKGQKIVGSIPAERVRYAGEGNYIARRESAFAIFDKKGNQLTEYKYQQINNFRDGMAGYMRDDYWGFLDSEGKEACPAIFGLLWDFSDGLARAAFREGIAYVDKSLEPTFIPRFIDMQDYTEGLAAVQVP